MYFKNNSYWFNFYGSKVYEGNWTNDKMNGKGIFTWSNGS